MSTGRAVVLALVLLAMASVKLGVYCYHAAGRLVHAGSYEGLAVYWYEPEPAAVVLALAWVSTGFLLVAASTRASRRLLWAAAAAVSALAVSSVACRVLLPAPVLPGGDGRGWVTDSYVLQVEAARSLLEGRNPYTLDYSRVLLERLDSWRLWMITWVYGDAPPYSVDRITGFVGVYDYLPHAALWYVPAVALGVPGWAWDLAASALLAALLYKRSRPILGGWPALLASMAAFAYLAPAAVHRDPSPGWVVPLAAAVVLWDRPVVAGALLGWAAGYRLYAGVYAAYYAAAWLAAGRRRETASLAAAAVLVLLAPVIPFLALDPHAFLENAFLPLHANLRPLDGGPGLASLAFLGLDAPRVVHDALTAGIALAGLAAVLLRRIAPGHALYALPALAMLCYYRPIHVYYSYFPLLALAAYTAGPRGEGRAVRPRPRARRARL